MAMTEDQKKEMEELYEKMVNESARELASHRTPCKESAKLKIVSSIFNSQEKGTSLEFPPNGSLEYELVRDGKIIVKFDKNTGKRPKDTNSMKSK